jgi:hypothetical protein
MKTKELMVKIASAVRANDVPSVFGELRLAAMRKFAWSQT